MKDTLKWEDRSKRFPDEKGRLSLEYYHPIIGHWSAGTFTKSQQDTALDAFKRGMEIGMRRAHAEMSSHISGFHELPDISNTNKEVT